MTGAEVRGEAARLVRRLEAAEQRLAEAHTPRGRGESAPRRRINEVDDEVRTLLAPASNRVAELVELARALADGSLSDESAERSARAIAATQPSRRPR